MIVYDFDKTLYRGDSSLNFYFFCINRKIFLLKYLPIQLYGVLGYFLKLHSKERMKELFFSFLNGVENIDAEVDCFWSIEKKKIYPWYRNQQTNDDVVISASPAFLLEPIIKDLGIKNLIATIVDKHTGKFLSKNCYGEEKVREFKKRFSSKILKFYSDSYSDQPLADIAEEAFMIKKGNVERWENI